MMAHKFTCYNGSGSQNRMICVFASGDSITQYVLRHFSDAGGTPPPL